MTGAFQPMPDLTADEFDALRADIFANGVLVPVVKDQHGRIIDGNHRAAIAAELGIDYPVQTVEVADDADAVTLAVALNCTRRHLTREQVRAIIANEIARCPGDSDRAIARRVGCSPSTVGAVRTELRREAEELRREAEERRRRLKRELIEEIRETVDNARGQVIMRAVMLHHEGHDWQTVGDVVERMTYAAMSKLDSDFSKPNVWGPLLGVVFDAVRAYDCPDDCEFCTPAQRQWRDEHPQQVYRWPDPPEVSKLDTENAAVGDAG